MSPLRLATPLLLAFVALAAAQDEPAPKDAPVPLPCPTCDGAGRVKQDCWICRGEGIHPCVTCRSYRAARPSRGDTGWVPAAALADLEESLANAMKALGDLPPLPGSKKAPKPVKLQPGERRCPAGCRGGELLLIDDWIDCKVCKSGKLDCELCRRGEQECGRCDGRGRTVEACEDCAGMGSLPDATGIAAAVCPWCFGANMRACGTCAAEGLTPAGCLACLDLKRVACETCRGFGRIPCATCRGRGRTGPQKLECTTCDGKGVSGCDRCDDGAVACSASADKPTASACPDCSGAQEHACNGCAAGAYVAWERTAEVALAGGHAARAAALLTAAHERCAQRYEEALARYADLKDEASRERVLRAIEKERDAELRRLAGLREDAEKAERRAAGG